MYCEHEILKHWKIESAGEHEEAHGPESRFSVFGFLGSGSSLCSP